MTEESREVAEARAAVWRGIDHFDEDEMTPLERIELKLDALLAMDVGATLTYKRALREVSLRAARGEESRP